jgi:hypothetical protein
MLGRPVLLAMPYDDPNWAVPRTENVLGHGDNYVSLLKPLLAGWPFKRADILSICSLLQLPRMIFLPPEDNYRHANLDEHTWHRTA